MLTSLIFASLLICLQAPSAGEDSSRAKLSEGYYQLTVTVDDTTTGRGVQGISVTMKLRRGFLFLGRKKTDLVLSTDKAGQVVIDGLPRGKVELSIALSNDRPLEYEPDLQSGTKGRVQLRSGRFSVVLEWKLL